MKLMGENNELVEECYQILRQVISPLEHAPINPQVFKELLNEYRTAVDNLEHGGPMDAPNPTTLPSLQSATTLPRKLQSPSTLPAEAGGSAGTSTAGTTASSGEAGGGEPVMGADVLSTPSALRKANRVLEEIASGRRKAPTASDAGGSKAREPKGAGAPVHSEIPKIRFTSDAPAVKFRSDYFSTAGTCGWIAPDGFGIRGAYRDNFSHLRLIENYILSGRDARGTHRHTLRGESRVAA
jgi:hypothetical protein